MINFDEKPEKRGQEKWQIFLQMYLTIHCAKCFKKRFVYAVKREWENIKEKDLSNEQPENELRLGDI